MITVEARKRYWAILLVCLFAVSFASAAYADAAPKANGVKAASWYTKKSTKLYKKKNMDSEVVGSVPAGVAVTVLKSSGSWWKISYSGVTGFVKKARLKKKDAQGDQESGVAPVTEIYDISKLKTHGVFGENVNGIDNSGLTNLDKSKGRVTNWSSQIVLGEGGMAIPMLYQYDYDQTVCVYNGVARSVATSGCGATSLSMIITYLTGNTEQSPYTLFRDACQDEMYSGDGLGRGVLVKLAKRYNIKGEWKNLSAKEIIETLKGGTPIIAHMGSGYFTKNGHYIVLRGVTDEGKILVNDPASEKNNTKAFPIELFIKEKRSGHAFMVATKLEVSDDSKDSTIYIVPSVESTDTSDTDGVVVVQEGAVTETAA